VANQQEPNKKPIAARIAAFLNQDQWAVELGSLPTLKAMRIKFSRVFFLTVRGFISDRCMFRASGLTYITILSLVPMLAFAFSVAKGLGAYGKLRDDTIEPFLESTFGAVGASEVGAGAVGAEVSAEGGLGDVRQVIETMLGYVEDTDVSGLGLFGMALLAFTAIKLLGSIEQSFNEIWGVHRSRTLIRKVSDYMSITVVVPILLVTATGVNSAAENAEFTSMLREKWHLGPLFEMVAKLSSLFVMWIGFAFVYLFMPNTKVRISSALIGGIVGGTLWQAAQVIHVAFQMGVAKYNALYAGFAALPVFMIWIHVSWVTVLLGAEAAHAHHAEPSYQRRIGALRLTQMGREVMALRTMVRVVARFLRGETPPNVEDLSLSSGVPAETLEEVLEPIRSKGLISRVEEDDEVCYLPGRDPAQIHVQDVLDAMRVWSADDLAGGDRFSTVVSDCLDSAHESFADSRLNLDMRRLALKSLEESAEADAEGEAASDGLAAAGGSPA
jgi:membrane protein